MNLMNVTLTVYDLNCRLILVGDYQHASSISSRNVNHCR